jgi:hypothetical protein
MTIDSNPHYIYISGRLHRLLIQNIATYNGTDVKTLNSKNRNELRKKDCLRVIK